MKRTEMKYYAQDELMFSMGVAFARLEDACHLTSEEREEVRKEMSKQMSRVEKLFGYESNTFHRGC